MDENKSSCNLITATSESETSILKLLPVAAAIPLFSFPSKKDPGGIGFIDHMGGGVGGLMSCTESLGFESSDERIDHQMDMEMDARMSNNQSVSKTTRWRKDNHHGSSSTAGERKEVKKFPPPLSSFNRNGQPSFFLRSVRSDGRLELTEVRIDRPEILRASREDGRLRLRLIREDELDIDSEHNDEETLSEEEEEEEEEEETLEEEEEEETLEEAEEEERVGEWKLEGFRRCKEMMGRRDYHHHHQQQQNHLHVWSQQCVPVPTR